MSTFAEYRHPVARFLARILDSQPTRILMIGVVLGSVIQEIHVFNVHWALYTALFLVIAALRGVILPQKIHRSAFDWLLLIGDVLIALTFLPWDAWLPWVTPQQLHTLWVARLLVLLRPSRYFLGDLWGVLTRRERVQQFFSVTMAVVILSLLAATVLRNTAAPFNYDGIGDASDDAFLDALWWAFRQLESPDNLVPHLEHDPVITVVSLLLTVTGVFIIAFIIGLGAGVVEQMVQAERRRPVDYEDHSIIIGPIHDAEILVREFVRLHEKNRSLRRIRPRDLWMWIRGRGPIPRRHALPRIVLLGQDDTPPPFLYEPMMRRVLYRGAETLGDHGLALVAAEGAKRALILSHTPDEPQGDATTLATLGALRQRNPKATLFAEILDPGNRRLAEAIGGVGTLALDVPRIMGQFLAQHLVIPGIDRVFQDLLTAQGSEFYTHIFVTEWEHEALARLLRDRPTLPWAELRALGEAREVSLVGVLLRPRGGPPPRGKEGLNVRGLHLWLNPLDAPFDDALLGDVVPGQIPLDRLAGLVGISETYAELKGLGMHLLNHPEDLTPPAPVESSALALAKGLRHDDGDLAQVLVVGEGPALRALVSELFTLRPGLEVILLLPEADQGETALPTRLGELGVDWLAQTEDRPLGGVAFPTRTGRGRLRIRLARRGTMAQTAAALSEGIVRPQAAVFLGRRTAGTDPDAATAHRVLRFVEALYPYGGESAKPLHLLVELHAEARGERLEADLRAVVPRARGVSLTAVSADRIKNYFMVHSAFVPAVDQIYETLLSESGQDLMRLVPPALTGSMTFEALVRALAHRRMVPLAYALRGEGPVLHPPPDTVVDLGRLEALFVMGDTRRDGDHRAAMPVGEEA